MSRGGWNKGIPHSAETREKIRLKKSRDLIEVICHHCRQVYKVIPSRVLVTKYCSQRCADIVKQGRGRNRVLVICQCCEETYEVIPAKVSSTKFCSMICRAQSLRKYNKITCVRCEKVFFPESGQQIYCSKKCRIRPRPVHMCEQCGNEFTVGHINQPGRFCSDNCKHIFQCGTQNPNFKGAPEIKYGWDWRKIRQRVIERDQAACQECGKTKLHNRDLNVHHIVPYRICRSHNEDNLIVLCDSCHGKIEKRLPMSGRPGRTLEMGAYVA